MSEKFKKAFKEVILHEGGYSNHPNDKGGPTNFGITEKKAREYGYKGDMKNLPIEVTEKIYKDGYWRKEFEEMPYILADFLFDCNVNHGYKGMSIILQNAINSLTKNNVEVDGCAGKITYGKINELNKDKLFCSLIAHRITYYVDICKKNESQEVFYFGWLSRTFSKLIKAHSKK